MRLSQRFPGNGDPLNAARLCASHNLQPQELHRGSIESVLAQTFKDFELVIVDDASTDRTVEIVQRYCVDPRVRFVRNEKNLGDYPNRNYAAPLARGELIKYHDSDDVMYPHCLELMVQPLIDEPRADFAVTSASSWLGGPVPMLQTPELSYSRQFFGGFSLFSGGPGNALFRAAFFESLGRFPMAFGASDYLFWIKAFAVGNALLVPADLYWYRVHPAREMQESRQQFNLARVDGAMWQMLRSVECPIKGRCSSACPPTHHGAHGVIGVSTDDVARDHPRPH